jgi:hypothetical protein
VYDAVGAIAHHKPVVAVSIAEGDYHTPPNPTRLAMAEAAAHGAAYLMWPTWPVEQREKMIAAIRPESDFLRQNAALLNGTTVVADAIVFLPFRQWTQTAQCKPLETARALARQNIQYRIVDEDDLAAALDGNIKTLIIESPKVLTDAEAKAVEMFKAKGGKVIATDSANWLAEIKPSTITVKAPPTVRAVVREKQAKTIVHLLNLNIERLSSFQDRVTRANDIAVELQLNVAAVHSVRAVSSDAGFLPSKLEWKSSAHAGAVNITVAVPPLETSLLLVIE